MVDADGHATSHRDRIMASCRTYRNCTPPLSRRDVKTRSSGPVHSPLNTTRQERKRATKREKRSCRGKKDKIANPKTKCGGRLSSPHACRLRSPLDLHHLFKVQPTFTRQTDYSETEYKAGSKHTTEPLISKTAGWCRRVGCSPNSPHMHNRAGSTSRYDALNRHLSLGGLQTARSSRRMGWAVLPSRSDAWTEKRHSLW